MPDENVPLDRDETRHAANTDCHCCVPQPCRAGGPCGPAGGQGKAGQDQAREGGPSASAPGQSADKNAAKACKAERGTTAQSIAAFKEKYGTNKNKANAFGKCVSGMAKKLEAQAAEDENEAETQAEKNAAKKCKELARYDT